MPRTRFHAFLVVLALLVGPFWYTVAQSQSRETADPAAPLFDDTVLHDVRLAVSTRDWESLKEHFGDNTRYAADIRWRDQTVRGVAIKSRGSGSRSGIKPGLKIDVNYFSTEKRLVGLKNLILRNNTQDPSNMRELLSMALFRRLGVKAPRESFARLFVNDNYVGLYTIVEAVDKQFVEQSFEVNDPYIYEYDFEDRQDGPYTFEYRGSDPALYVPSPFRPETHESNPRAEVLERFIWTINDSAEASWRSRMDEFLDLNKFMRHLGIENFLAEQDGLTGDYGPNNFYMFRPENNNRFTLVPWDKSQTFWESPNYYIFRNIRDGQPSHRNRLVVRALGHRDLMNAYLDALLEAADSAAETGMEPAADGPAAPGWLEREVSAKYSMIREAARSDGFKPFSNDDFEQAANDLLTFARERSEAVRRMVAEERPQ